MQIVEFIGPISPPFSGPGVKNQIIIDEIKSRNYSFKLYSFNTLNKSFIINFLFHFFKNSQIKRITILSVSKNGRYILIPLIYFLTIFSNGRELVLLPAGGKFHDELKNLPLLLRNIYLKILSSFSKIIVETNELKNGLHELGVFSSQSPNPRKIKKLKFNKKTNDNINIYFISSIKKEKGILDAIDAVEILNKKGLNVKLVIHGRIMKGFEFEFNKKLSNSPCSIFKGGLENNKVIDILNENAHFLLLPTYYPGEGLPGVLVESTIAEVPFLVTKIHGIEDYFINNKTMVQINKNDPHDIAEKLYDLIISKEKYNNIIQNQKLTKDNFSVSKFLNKIL